MTSSGAGDYHNEQKSNGPGVVTGRCGTIGEVFYTEGPFWPLNTALYVRDFKGNDPRFCYFFLKTLDWHKFNDKSGIPGINRNDVHREPVVVPPLSEQRQIAATLGVLDDKIELNRKTAATLEAMTQALYRSWFVNFDPVVAKSEERKPAFMSDEVAALFPNDLSPDGIPVGWTVGKLVSKGVCSIAKAITKAPLQDSYDYLPTANIHESYIRRFVKHTPEDLPSRARMAWKGNRVFVAKMKDSPKHFQTLEAHQAFWNEKLFSTGFVGLDPASGYGSWLYSYIQSQEFEDQKNALVSGAVMQALNNESIKSIDVIVPPPAVAAAYEDQVKLWRQKAFDLYLENLTLAELRDTLLPKLMSGEIRVGSAETDDQP